MARFTRGSSSSSSLARAAFSPEVNIAALGLPSLGGGERAPFSGTKALMLAVLDNAITCYLSRTPRVRSEAEYWIKTAQNGSPFSFIVVCETLGLEPSAVRTALQRLRDETRTRRPAISRRRPNVRREGRLLTPKL